MKRDEIIKTEFGSLNVTYRGGAYFIQKDGRDVYGPITRSDTVVNTAHRLAQEHEREARVKKRQCMTCEKSFESEGAHNRLCDLCRKMSLYEGVA